MAPTQKFGIDGRWVSTGVSLPEGGQAHVLIVIDSTGQRPGEYVLKRLKNAKRTARLANEIRTTKQLFSKECPVLEIVDDYLTSEPDADRPWYVSPLVRDGSLSRHLESGRHYGGSFTMAIKLYGKIASAIQSLHRQGIAHRDLKPDNILITQDGVVLADLGLSLVLGEYEGERLTGELERIGSLHYTPPEGYSRRPVDQNQYGFDAYAMGKILYEVLAGKPLPAFVSPTDPEYDLTKKWPGPAFRAINRVLRGLLSNDPNVRQAYFADLSGQIDELLALESAVPETKPHWHKDLLAASELLAQRVVPDEVLEEKRTNEDTRLLANEVLDVWQSSGVVGQLEQALGLSRGGHLQVSAPVVGEGLRAELGGLQPTRKGLEPLEDSGFPPRPTAESGVRLAVAASDANKLPFRQHVLCATIATSSESVAVAFCIVRRENGPRGATDIMPNGLSIQIARRHDASLITKVRADATNIIQVFVQVLLNEVRIVAG